jgi:uncharacterized protein Yka (UPF0111/DUF47 family)
VNFSLIPKNNAYFEDFIEAIEIALEIAKALHAAVALPEIPTSLFAQIKDLEKKSDGVVKRCLTRLDETFVTPIEREDIYLLMTRIDDVSDLMEAAVGGFDVYAIREPTPELRAMTAALLDMVAQLVVALKALPSMHPIEVRDAALKVGMLEEKVDQIYREALRDLFRRRPEAYELVRWKEIYDQLEDCADRCYQVSRVVSHIMVRHS